MSDARLQAKVSRLRQIIADAIPIDPKPTDVEADAWRRYQQFACNDPLPALDGGDYARKVRNINRIAISYGWIGELQHQLDKREASSLQALDDTELEAVHDRFVMLESCYRDGCNLPDGPHAS